MKRIASLWLPHWRTGPRPPASDAPPEPFALTETTAGVERLAAVSATAATAGLAPGMTLADARARVPGLTVRPDDPPAAARRLDALAGWAQRFAPWTAPCGADGLWLDISGCGHLFGGEAALAARLSAGLERRGHDCRVGIASTPGAAWALARFAGGGRIRAISAGAAHAALAPLPTTALRLAPETAAALARVGLRRVGDLYSLPRAPLTRRFGRHVPDRLDQALGRRAEPVSPRRPPPRYRAQTGFVEPVADSASVAAALDSLIDRLCADLARDGLGARRLTLRLFRVDGDERAHSVGAARARRDARGLAALFAERLDGFDAGLGIEVMRLEAPLTEPMTPRQTRLDTPDNAEGPDAARLAALVDRLANRLGAGRVVRLAPRDTHLPDRAVRRRAAWPEPRNAGAWPAVPRPLRLFSPPHPVEATAAVPDGPPMLFRWRGRAVRVARASGPERIADEWWREDAPTRDYYCVEDSVGARYWVYREGFYESAAGPPRWYLHGLFG